MLIFIIVAVFVAGMMIGRTPEFLGKKVEAKEMSSRASPALASAVDPGGPRRSLLRLGTTAGPRHEPGLAQEPGPHGFSEMLYEFSSATATTGRASRAWATTLRSGTSAPASRCCSAATSRSWRRSRWPPRSPRSQSARDGRVAAGRERYVRVHAVGSDRDPRPADVHAGGRARADRRAPGAFLSCGANSCGPEVRRGVLFTVVTMILLGSATTFVLWGIGRVLFPAQAEGSLLRRGDGSVIGSRLVAQGFTRPSTSTRGPRPWTTTRPRPAAATTARRTRIT